ncbi:5-dehydro-4-deoxy-D-glucuronate isomerase [Glaciecola sp. MH2013]|uniref:5-dehydro-4-deoxy-D-glucuronate isomerase n=1 Tax=Glaciecola sp. MH2013 TaxID=2785524 RepID=UPI00189E3385|nr:5-dehydro-4-deoxy-D-glucuronate isomerase [Glaciecola sp. MH2013]MBF7073667.1 5-dehydro-4-deoxy-D-glucuronate isomerase [Glaciecola sp. MH2013]
MEFLLTPDQNSYKRMTNAELEKGFVVPELFVADQITLTYTDVDRAVVGGVMPLSQTVVLPTHKELASDFFCERREVGVINIGSAGQVSVDGVVFDMANKDSLYIGRGSKEVLFTSKDAAQPAKFYIVSYPAHTAFPTKLIAQADANKLDLGEQEQSNKRVIYQSLCPKTLDSCQLVMGITEIASGNVWNTKPPHTHARRTEVYMYFDIPSHERVFHFMGEPSNVRAVVMKPETAIASPSWSIHSGVGSTNYTFIWAMGGENQEFDDMDHLTLEDIS